MFVLLLLAALASCRQTRPAAPAATFPGYIMTAEWQCDDFLCPQWSLTVTRVTTDFSFHETTVLATLVPETAESAMFFPVYTAYNNVTRNFHVVGEMENKIATIWTVNFDNSVDNGTLIATATAHFPASTAAIVRVHSSVHSSLLILWDSGVVSAANYSTGALSTVGDLLSSPSVSTQLLAQASAVNTAENLLYSLTQTTSAKAPFVLTMNLATGDTSVVPLVLDASLKNEKWDQETLFHALWIAQFSKLLVFATGTDLGFDQVLWVDPTTGDVTPQYADLSQNNFFFRVQPSTHTNDLLQCACFDEINNFVYFQVTLSDVDDDTADATDIASIDLNHLSYPPDVQVTFTFGYLGYAFVPVLN
eukprot:m.38763 g.38763  ORF g.38763 m.38763 type:complete len:363 (-) comp45365_c0_seq1:155-1243(-)